MLGGTKRRVLPVTLIALVLCLAALAGCVGSDDAEVPDQQAEDDAVEPASVNETGSEASVNEPPSEPELREIETSFEGQGSGIGFAPTGSNFWFTGTGISHDIQVPSDHEGGTISFEWSATQNLQGLWLWFRDDGQNSVHVFVVQGSPVEIELEPGDERIQGASELLILPHQGDVANLSLQTAWSGTLSLLAPVSPSAPG